MAKGEGVGGGYGGKMAFPERRYYRAGSKSMMRKGKIKYAVNCIVKFPGTRQKIGRAHTSLGLYNSAECILIISHGARRGKRAGATSVPFPRFAAWKSTSTRFDFDRLPTGVLVFFPLCLISPSPLQPVCAASREWVGSFTIIFCVIRGPQTLHEHRTCASLRRGLRKFQYSMRH